MCIASIGVQDCPNATISTVCGHFVQHLRTYSIKGQPRRDEATVKSFEEPPPDSVRGFPATESKNVRWIEVRTGMHARSQKLYITHNFRPAEHKPMPKTLPFTAMESLLTRRQPLASTISSTKFQGYKTGPKRGQNRCETDPKVFKRGAKGVLNQMPYSETMSIFTPRFDMRARLRVFSRFAIQC